jgi:hypothetical protein
VHRFLAAIFAGKERLPEALVLHFTAAAVALIHDRSPLSTEHITRTLTICNMGSNKYPQADFGNATWAVTQITDGVSATIEALSCQMALALNGG